MQRSAGILRSVPTEGPEPEHVEDGLVVEVRRRVGAEATGVALLLAGASAADFWPGLRRLPVATASARRPGRGPLGGRDRGPLSVEAVVPGVLVGRDAVTPVRTFLELHAAPPRRGPDSFVLDMRLSGGPDAADVVGRLTLTPSAHGGSGTTVRMSLSCDLAVDCPSRAAVASVLAGCAERFVANLASAAESRATVA